LGKSIYGKERIISQRRGKPIAMIVPLQNSEIKKGGLATFPWEEFEQLADYVDQSYQLRARESYREIPF